MSIEQQNQTRRIILKDGRSRIADWPQQEGTHLTVGDRVTVPQDVAGSLPGYLTEGTVTRVEFDTASGGWNVEAEVGCPVPESNRPVVTLNSSRIEEAQRAEVEAHLRKRVDYPVFDWEDSFESSPVLRIHDHGADLQAKLPQLQSEVLKMLKVSPELSVL
ncbi:MAG: hypothetical protein EOP88_17935 [Verrucomicrobiaceae bacterium]|nr:MAG: hypothetical protein EOP88_17935 [Verrucomicrobiaceae bacterium]